MLGSWRWEDDSSAPKKFAEKSEKAKNSCCHRPWVSRDDAGFFQHSPNRGLGRSCSNSVQEAAPFFPLRGVAGGGGGGVNCGKIKRDVPYPARAKFKNSHTWKGASSFSIAMRPARAAVRTVKEEEEEMVVEELAERGREGGGWRRLKMITMTRSLMERPKRYCKWKRKGEKNKREKERHWMKVKHMRAKMGCGF